MDFQSEKSFGKLRLRAFQLYHQILRILKHVEDVKDNLWHLQHTSTYIKFDGMVVKLSVSAFQNFFRIEDPLSIKEVLSQNVCVCSLPISTSSTYIALQPLGVFDVSLTSLTYIALQPLGVFDLSSTSSTYIGLHSNDTILRKVW